MCARKILSRVFYCLSASPSVGRDLVETARLHPGGYEMKVFLIASLWRWVCACNRIISLPFNVVWCRKRLHDDALLKEEDRHVWPELLGSPCSLERDSFHSDPGNALSSL